MGPTGKVLRGNGGRREVCSSQLQEPDGDEELSCWGVAVLVRPQRAL